MDIGPASHGVRKISRCITGDGKHAALQFKPIPNTESVNLNALAKLQTSGNFDRHSAGCNEFAAEAY